MSGAVLGLIALGLVVLGLIVDPELALPNSATNCSWAGRPASGSRPAGAAPVLAGRSRRGGAYVSAAIPTRRTAPTRSTASLACRYDSRGASSATAQDAPPGPDALEGTRARVSQAPPISRQPRHPRQKKPAPAISSRMGPMSCFHGTVAKRPTR